MNDEMTWKAAMSSEIFREYAKNEVGKMQVEAEQKEEEFKKIERDKSDILDQLKEFENQVRSSSKKLAVFKALQNKFATDIDYASKVNKSFVDAVMMLDLS